MVSAWIEVLDWTRVEPVPDAGRPDTQSGLRRLRRDRAYRRRLGGGTSARAHGDTPVQHPLANEFK
jgi:hypothetical protein